MCTTRPLLRATGRGHRRGVRLQLGRRDLRHNSRASTSGTGAGSSEARQPADPTSLAEEPQDWLEMAADYLLDPVSGSPTKGKTVDDAMLIHVDDMLVTGTKSFNQDMASSRLGHFSRLAR